MPRTAVDSHGTAVHNGGPGRAMRQVAEKLAAHGFDVCLPEREAGRCLQVANLPGTTCDITVEDNGAVTWEYWREVSQSADPGRVIALALRLLTDDSVDYPGASPPGTAGCSLHGIVGRELEARGLDVSLDVYADHVCFEAWGEIVATNPAQPQRGRVRVGDEPGLLWKSGCCGAGYHDTDAIADLIVTVLTADVADGYVQRGEPALDGAGRENGR